jgi:Flp pilus assembly pilin Flp
MNRSTLTCAIVSLVLRARCHPAWRAERGSSAIEYALLASLIAVTIVGAMMAVGSNVSSSFYDKIANALS